MKGQPPSCCYALFGSCLKFTHREAVQHARDRASESHQRQEVRWDSHYRAWRIRKIINVSTPVTSNVDTRTPRKANAQS